VDDIEKPNAKALTAKTDNKDVPFTKILLNSNPASSGTTVCWFFPIDGPEMKLAVLFSLSVSSGGF
jgi:hypothetical protein